MPGHVPIGLTESPTDAWSQAGGVAWTGVFRLFARLWVREIDREATPPLGDAFVAAGGHLPRNVDERTLELLACEYCRLFLGPTGHLPPYQSVWQGGQFQSAAVDSMQGFADVVGYDLGRLPPGVMPDHLGTQLDLLAEILSCGNRLEPVGGHGTAPAAVSEVAVAFTARHLRWPDPFLEAAEAHAKDEFYRSLIVMTRALLADWAAALDAG